MNAPLCLCLFGVAIGYVSGSLGLEKSRQEQLYSRPLSEEQLISSGLNCKCFLLSSDVQISVVHFSSLVIRLFPPLQALVMFPRCLHNLVFPFHLHKCTFLTLKVSLVWATSLTKAGCLHLTHVFTG